MTGPVTDVARVVTIGVFDGVHAGHRALIDAARDEADELDVPLVVLTFDPHPMSVVRPELVPCRLASIDQRGDLLLAAGADNVRVVTFDEALSQLSPEEFVKQWLVDRLRAAAVVVGDNFRFGHRASGDLSTLRELGDRYGFTVTALDLAVSDDDVVWSSTRIREMIRSGDVSGAAQGLGHPPRVEGVVVRGEQRGRELGYPTANLAVAPGACVPADGVYAARAVLAPGTAEQREVAAAVSVGANSTFGGTEPRIEAYLMEAGDWDLYGRHLAIDFIQRLRGMVTFADVDELLAAMATDVDEARRILAMP